MATKAPAYRPGAGGGVSWGQLVVPPGGSEITDEDDEVRWRVCQCCISTQSLARCASAALLLLPSHASHKRPVSCRAARSLHAHLRHTALAQRSWT